jgi:[acyl-carrier-protein] S-malonyltransferase
MKKIALMFPGQGSQYIGMGKKLYDNFECVRKVYEEANDTIGFDLKGLCFEGDMEELTKTENTQPAILTTSVAMFRVYQEEIGIEPAFMAGHSLGELSALTCSGAIRFSDAVKLVRQRGKFMQEAVPIGIGGMAAISGADISDIEAECKNASKDGNIVAISNYNSYDQIVISGHKAAVESAGEALKEKGVKVIPLKVSAPFHSPLMKPAADRFKDELKKYCYDGPRCHVISNVTALPYEGAESIQDNLIKQITSPVQWIKSMEYLESNGVEMFIELGPKKVLKNLVGKIVKIKDIYSYDHDQDVNNIKSLLK